MLNFPTLIVRAKGQVAGITLTTNWAITGFIVHSSIITRVKSYTSI